MIEREDLEYVGRFGKAHGYKGEVNLSFSQFDGEEWLRERLPLFVEIDGCAIPFFVKDYRPRGQEMTWLVTFEGHEPAGLAKTLERHDVYALREKVLELYPDFLPEDEMKIEGWKLSDSNYGSIGVVTYFDQSTENLLVDVKMPDGREVTLPFNLDFIIEEDEEEKKLTLEYPDGLLDSLLDPSFQTGENDEI